MTDLPQRLRELAACLESCEWEVPLCSRETCVRAADEIERLQDDRDSESRWAGAYLAKLLRCQKLLRDVTSNPERVTEGGVRCWEILLSDEWMDEAESMGGD